MRKGLRPKGWSGFKDRSGREFPAKYPGMCAACRKPFDVGQSIRYLPEKDSEGRSNRIHASCSNAPVVTLGEHEGFALWVLPSARVLVVVPAHMTGGVPFVYSSEQVAPLDTTSITAKRMRSVPDGCRVWPAKWLRMCEVCRGPIVPSELCIVDEVHKCATHARHCIPEEWDARPVVDWMRLNRRHLPPGADVKARVWIHKHPLVKEVDPLGNTGYVYIRSEMIDGRAQRVATTLLWYDVEYILQLHDDNVEVKYTERAGWVDDYVPSSPVDTQGQG